MTATRFGLPLLVGALAFEVAGAQAAAPCPSSWPTRAVLPAQLSAELRNGTQVVVRVCRGDKPLNFVLDTGANTSIFDLTTARELGISLGSGFRATGGGAGSAAGAQIPRDSVFIPGAGVTVSIGTAIDFRTLSRSSGRMFDGILGADFLARYIVVIDYRGAQVRLIDRATFTYEGAGSSVPFQLANSHIFVRGDVTLSDGARVPGVFVVDVGSGLALALAKPFVDNNRLRERVPRTVYRPSGRGVGGLSYAHVGRVESLTLGRVEIARPITYLHGDSAGVFSNASLGDGNIGGDILRRFTLYLDYGARRMILEPHAGTSEPFETDMSGLMIIASPATPNLVASFVLPNSPASEAGVRLNDVVVAVDGVPMNAASLEALRARLRRDGERVAFTVRRDGREIELRFVTRRIV